MKSVKYETTFVVAVIVLYKPETNRLHLLLNSTFKQVDEIIIVDNTDKPESTITTTDLVQYEDKLHYHPLHNNYGIAFAQNYGISYSQKINATHVLLLDQDSILPNDMVTCLIEHEMRLINDGISVAAVGPSFKDEKTGKISGAIHIKPFSRKIISGINQPLETDYLIASGCLINLTTLKKIGGMNDKLFIDLVDIEWCERARKMGFRSFVVPDIILLHSIGNEAKKILGKNVIVHSDFRHYFIVRNTIYLICRNKLTISHSLFLLFRLPLFMLIHTLNSRSKIKKMMLLIIALTDGVRGKMGKGYFSDL